MEGHQQAALSHLREVNYRMYLHQIYKNNTCNKNNNSTTIFFFSDLKKILCLHVTVKYVRICGRHRGPSSLCRHTAAKTIREKMTFLLHTAQSLFKMHPERGGNDFRARGCAPPQTFNDSFEFLVERPCVGARQTEDAPSTIGVGVCERGSMGGAQWIQCAKRSKIPECCRLLRSTA